MPQPKQFDTIIAGGGIAGIAAAVSSAKIGMKTALVERYGFPGGLATAGLVNPFMSSNTSTGQPLVGGFFDDLRHRLRSLGGITGGTFDNEAMKYALQELALEAGVNLFFHSWIHRTIVEDSIIRGVMLDGKGEPRTLLAERVIDTTGDADIAAMSGAPWESGRQEDGQQQSMTLMFDIGGVDLLEAVRYIKDHPDQMLFPKLPEEAVVEDIAAGVISAAGYYNLVAQAKQQGEFNLPGDLVFYISRPVTGEVVVNTTHVGQVDGTNPDDLTYAEVEARKQVQCLMQFFKKYVPGFENSYLLRMAPQIGIRETRRIMGEYVFGADDVIEGRKFPDAIARLAYPVDVHSAKGYTKEKQEGETKHPIGPPSGDWYEIPYRSLVPLKVENLLVAGRCISATHEGQGAVRIMPCCAAMGQAAGAAAALSIKAGVSPRRLDPQILIEELRRQGALV